MILLSHERRVSLAPTNVRHDADRLHPLRRTESDRDLAYLIRTLLRFSAQQERSLSSPTSSAAAVARSQDRPSPRRQFQRRVAVVGSVAHLVAKDPGVSITLNRSQACPVRCATRPAVGHRLTPTTSTPEACRSLPGTRASALRIPPDAAGEDHGTHDLLDHGLRRCELHRNGQPQVG
jgi:hypothetical protein